jgi:hypothetical protein
MGGVMNAAARSPMAPGIERERGITWPTTSTTAGPYPEQCTRLKSCLEAGGHWLPLPQGPTPVSPGTARR